MKKREIVKTKDTGVELMRILGCLIVIACHCVVAYKFDGVYYFPNTFIATLWADGVAMFWLIAGFFIFKSDNVAKKLKNFGLKRLIPALGIGGGLFYLYDWATSDTSLSESLSHTKQEYIDLLIGENGLLKLKMPFPQSGHFWYVIIYVMVLAVFPALKGFWDWMIQKPEREKGFMIITFVAMAINDWMLNETFNFWNLSIQALVPACIFVMWGAIIYRHKEIFMKWWLGLLAFGGFIGINILRARTIVSSGEGHFLYWFTTFGLIASVCVYVFCINIGKLLQNNIAGKIVCYISSFTFMVYLVHYGMKDAISYIGIKDKIRELSPPGAPMQIFGYTALMTLATFIASFILVVILHYIKVGIVALWKSGKKSGKKSKK